MRFDFRRLWSRYGPWGHVRLSPRNLLLAFALLVGAASLSLGSIYYGTRLHKTRRAETLDAILDNLAATKLGVVPHYLKGITFAKPDRLAIQIKQKYFLELVQRRNNALQSGILSSDANDFVPATLYHGDQVYDVRMRLKGDWTDHLLGNKWSFRVKVKGDQSLFGMKQFSLHHPRARNFAYEWLFHRALEREDILSLRYEFVEVTLNGKNLGVYALEEHFEKRLIESSRRRSGPIIKLNEELLWVDRAAHPGGPVDLTGLESEHAGSVDTFSRESILQDKSLFQRFQLAHHLLESFRYGELPAHRVFDARRLGTFYALCDLLGTRHAAIWHNLRFYFNPVTSLLEPIGFDANAGHRTASLLGAECDWEAKDRKFTDLAFSDPMVFAEYVKALERMAQESYVETLLGETHEELQKQLTILYKEFPYFHFSADVLRHNRAAIAATLSPAKGLHAYVRGRSGTTLEIEAGNIQRLPIEVVQVVYRDSLALSVPKPVLLPPKMATRPVDYRSVSFALPGSLHASAPIDKQLKLSYRILGTSTLRSIEVFPWARTKQELAVNDVVRQEPNVAEFPCVSIDEAKRRIAFQPGSWELGTNLVIPAGYEVVCGEGTELVLGNAVTILSFSPFRFVGSEESPIVVRSQATKGGSLVVMNTGGESFLEYVHFLGMSNPDRGGWELTSAITFHEAPVQFSHCLFGENHSEDVLNIFRSDFVIENCVFRDTSDDAFDSDFSNGRVANSLFVNCGNDAVDVSGSVVEVVDSRVEGTGDKGVSCGENSVLTARNVQLTRASIALASKDMSELRGDGIRITDSEVGMTLYQKKPEFGPATMILTDLQMTRVQVPSLVEQNSNLVIDGDRVAANRDKLRQELYGVVYGRASR